MKIKVAFFEIDSTLNLKFHEQNKEFPLNFGEVAKVTEYVGGEVYEGDYEVTPSLQAQTLPTSQKVMLNDMKIRKIPITTVSNTSGGNTVIIGS